MKELVATGRCWLLQEASGSYRKVIVATGAEGDGCYGKLLFATGSCWLFHEASGYYSSSFWTIYSSSLHFGLSTKEQKILKRIRETKALKQVEFFKGTLGGNERVNCLNCAGQTG